MKNTLMLFDLSIRGHHPNYIQYLIKYWQKKKIEGNLKFVVSPRFLNEHANVVDLALSDIHSIEFIPISQEEESSLRSRKTFLKRSFRNFQEVQILYKYINILNPSHCLVMYFDTLMVPLALRSKIPCPLSAIYFRPTLHYREFSSYKLSGREHIQRLREKIILSRILNITNLKTLFCLDPFVINYLNKLKSCVNTIFLPDPVEIQMGSNHECDQLRKTLKIESNRKIFLLFGALTTRKGIYQLLDAISGLPSYLCKDLCLLLIGESSIKDDLASKISKICQLQPVQVISHFEFVSDQDMYSYFKLADVILAPYQNHVGMSGILILAAAAGKPVLSSDYGLMGEIVRLHKLGLSVNSTLPKEIAKGLTRFLTEGLDNLVDYNMMKSFAMQNSSDEFARIIFEKIILDDFKINHSNY